MYPYLGWSALLGVLWLIIWYWRKDLRPALWFGALVSAPFGLMQPLFVPSYWYPTVIGQWRGFDLESIVWSFFLGGIVAVLYEFAWRKKLIKSRTHRPYAKTVYGIIGSFAVFLLVIALQTEFSLLHSAFVFIGIAILGIWWIRKDLVWMSLQSGILFMIVYTLILLLIHKFSHGILDQWNPNGSWGISWIGIVAEEYIYAFLVAVIWSMLYPMMKGLDIGKKKV